MYMNIMIVEDEQSIREVEAAYISKAGYTVTEVSSGLIALNTLDHSNIDLVILDLNLPGMSGLEVCKAIREFSTIPILMVTAMNSDEDEITGLRLGADDYIKKPFNPNILVARVQALLRNHESKKLHFNGLTIDPKAMSVVRDGLQISLTTTRFNLLQVLASQPGVVFSRGELVDRIYSEPAGHLVYERTIDAHIKALRQQIETDPKQPKYIQTVIGAGYRFQGEM